VPEQEASVQLHHAKATAFGPHEESREDIQQQLSSISRAQERLNRMVVWGVEGWTASDWAFFKRMSDAAGK